MFLAIVRLHVSEKKARTKFMGAYPVFLYFQNVEFFEKIFFLNLTHFAPVGLAPNYYYSSTLSGWVIDP